MNIAFKCLISRVAILDPKLTGGKVVQVGEIEEYRKTDTEVSVNIRLNEDLPQEMMEAIHKNPGCLRLSEGLSSPQNVIILPSRPKLIT